MSEQQISRLNLYSGIHKALRAYMNDTVQRTSRIDGEDAEDLSGGLRQVRELLAFMRKHLQHEARHVHPAMNARRPGSAQVTEGDHDHHDWAIDKLNALCDHVEQASGARRTAQLYHLQLQLSVFVGENLVHMRSCTVALTVLPLVAFGSSASFMPLASAERCVRFSMLSGLGSKTSPCAIAAWPL